MAVVAIDTNVLAYVAGLGRTADDRRKMRQADELLVNVANSDTLVFPVQVGLELHTVLIRKLGLSRPVAAEIVSDYLDGAIVTASDEKMLVDAMDLAAKHSMQTYDSIILASAASSGCTILYSEDMQHGFVWNGVMVVNPFA